MQLGYTSTTCAASILSGTELIPIFVRYSANESACCIERTLDERDLEINEIDLTEEAANSRILHLPTYLLCLHHVPRGVKARRPRLDSRWLSLTLPRSISLKTHYSVIPLAICNRRGERCRCPSG